MTDAAAASPDPRLWLKRQSRWSMAEIALWLAALTPFLLFPAYLSLASQIAITALFAVSVDLVLGYAGIVTLGHAMFFGLGAYAAGLLSKAGWGEPLSGLVVAAAFAGLVGHVVSFVIVRVQHLALIMITLGMGVLTYELANAMSWLTGGTDGLQGVDTWPLLGLSNAPNMLSKVLFPLPDGPTIDTNSPFFTLNVMFATPITLPACDSQNFERFLTSSARSLS